MRRRRRDAERPDESFWGPEGGTRFPISGSVVVDALGGVIAVLVVGTIVGLAVLWPHGKIATHGALGPVRTLGAVIEQATNVPCKLSASHSCRGAGVKLLDGPSACGCARRTRALSRLTCRARAAGVRTL